MRSTRIILVMALLLFSPLFLFHDVQAQHGDDGMGFGVSVFDHDIEITQIDDVQIHVVEKITCFNPSDNESYSDTITCWIMAGSQITRFGPLVNETYQGGNYSAFTSEIYQYDLGENGFEIPFNDTIMIILEYTITFSSDTFRFDKTFYYTNYFLVVSVYPVPDTEIRTTNINLQYNSPGKYYVTHDSAIRSLGDQFFVKFSPEEESVDGSLYLLLAMILVIAVIVIVYHVMSQNSDIQRALAKTSGKTGSKKSAPSKSISTKSQMRKDSISGNRGKQKYEPVKKIQTDEDLDALVGKKNSLLAAIKRLDEDHDAGLLSDDIHSELKEEYKLKAVELLKKIDEQT